MPDNLPSAIGLDESIVLDKGYYPGNIFMGPGVKVEIDGEWIPCDEGHRNVVESGNPMMLRFAVDGDLLLKQGYKSGSKVKLCIVAVDDRWKSSGFTKEFEVVVK